MSTEGGKNRLLPTEYAAVLLSQEESLVTSTFTHRLTNIASHVYPYNESFHLLVKAYMLFSSPPLPFMFPYLTPPLQVKSIKTRNTETYRHHKETKVVVRDVSSEHSPFKLFSQRGTSPSSSSQMPQEATLILRVR